MKRSVVFLPAIFFFWVMAARANIVYSNLGAGDTFDTSNAANNPSGNYAWDIGSNFPASGIPGSNQVIAQAFSPDATVFFTQASLALSFMDATGPNSVTITLASDSSQSPGSVLESFVVTPLPSPDSPALVTVISTIHPLLVAGTDYWLIVSGPDSADAPGSAPFFNVNAGWYLNNTGDVSNDYNFQSNETGSTSGPWLAYPGVPFTRGAFEVQGVPEPATFTLMGIGAALMAGHAWRRRTRVGY